MDPMARCDWRCRQIDERDVYPGTRAGALITDPYRYALHRQWSAEPPLVFVMLNPSTADHTQDDPTIRRCTGYAQHENAGGVLVVNLFAYRATAPAALAQHIRDYGDADAVGPQNGEAIKAALTVASHQGTRVVVAWGKPHTKLMREAMRHRIALLKRWAGERALQLFCLAVLNDIDRSPRHPLYLRSGLSPMRWG